MGEGIGRLWKRGPSSWLVVSSAMIVLSSFFVIAGAQIAGAAQCGRGQAACHLAFRLEDPAGSSIYTNTEPHRAGSGLTITNQDLIPTIDPSNGVLPVIVEIEDEFGHRDPTFVGQIMVFVSRASVSGWTLSGTTTANTMNGVGSFGDLNLNIVGDYQLTAVALTATGIAPVTSATFQIYSLCSSGGPPCTAPFQDLGQTLSEASMAYTGTGTGAVSNGSDVMSNCDVPEVFTDPFFHAPAEWSAIEFHATSDTTQLGTTQLIVVRIFKKWRQIVLDKGSSSYRVCATSPVPFVTWNGSPLTPDPLTGKYTGLLANCSMTNTGLCQAYVKSSKAGDIVEGISAPSSALVLDPRGN